MFYDHKVLNSDEIRKISKAQSNGLKDHDKLDLLIELIFSEEEKKNIKTRKRKKQEKKKETKTQELPESLKYCDGDHCVIDLETGGC